MAKYVKDGNWQTVYTVTATEMSVTAHSSTGTATYLNTRGAVAVMFRLVSATGSAGEYRIAPVFKSADNSTTDKPYDGSTAIYYPLAVAGSSTEPFGPIEAEYTTATVWVDASATDSATTIQMKRIPFLETIRSREDVTHVEITTANRDTLPQKILDIFSPG